VVRDAYDVPNVVNVAGSLRSHVRRNAVERATAGLTAIESRSGDSVGALNDLGGCDSPSTTSLIRGESPGADLYGAKHASATRAGQGPDCMYDQSPV